MLNKEEKTKVIEKHRLAGQDTGSAPVQIALLTERINRLTDHFKSHVKDHSSRRGLLMMVGKRRRLLNYLKKSDVNQYSNLIKELNIRK